MQNYFEPVNRTVLIFFQPQGRVELVDADAVYITFDLRVCTIH